MNSGDPVRFEGSLRIAIPPPGAVWPAIVRLPAVGLIWLRRLIVPATRNTQVRAPVAIMQARNEPVPESASVVTAIARPPRPPFDAAPNPSAVGKARCCPSGSFAGLNDPLAGCVACVVVGAAVDVAVGVGEGVGDVGSVTTLVVVFVPSLVSAQTCVVIARAAAVPAIIFEFLVIVLPDSSFTEAIVSLIFSNGYLRTKVKCDIRRHSVRRIPVKIY